MGRKAISLPPKACLTCGTMFERQKFGQRLEDANVFRKRRFCSIQCAKTKTEVTSNQYHKRARQFLAEACETCGATTGLHVHHKDEDITNNDPSNLSTLCGSCHLRWHWANGKTMPRKQSDCKICGKPSKGLDLCLKHYQRFRKYGDPCLTKRGNALGVYFVREDLSGSLWRC